MRRSVTTKDINSFSKLNMIYNQVRVIEAKMNQTDYKCLGSGKCCHIGLSIHMAECASIAFNLRQQYYLYLEDKGYEFADNWIDGVTEDLKAAMYDDSWQIGGESKRLCAFYKGGCSIYGYRPMVCRTFGTITTVDDYCPRIRNAQGSIDYFSGEGVKKIIKMFQDFLKEYARDKDNGYDMTVYMPLGVLSFLLEPEELYDLQDKTDPKFWKAVDGWVNYRVEYIKMHGYDHDVLEKEAEIIGVPLRFPKLETK
jgi:Fe-S-cluster containining protein